MSPVKRLRLLVCVLSLSVASACSNPCIDLANQICNCQPDSVSESNCQTNAQLAQGTFEVRSQDEAFCQKKLDEGACDCNKLDTPEGRANCGLSFSSSSTVPAR